MPYYAHSLPNEPDKSRWETMEQHEERVATRCRTFLERIHPDLGDWGDVLGRWHDLGKYSHAFQEYLTASTDAHTGEVKRRIDHSTAGAQYASKSLGKLGRLVAYCIAGHHSGLADWISAEGDSKSSLKRRLQKRIESYEAAPDSVTDTPMLVMPDCVWDPRTPWFQLSLITRLCFSALCDADFLATETFLDRERADLRESNLPSIVVLSDHLRDYLKRFEASKPTIVNQVRGEVHQAADRAASLPTGLFSFNVPTGGGKTLASLSFALQHAAAHGLERVIYAIPFTSIIEQTSDVFRDVFDDVGGDVVLEHHSNLDPDDQQPHARLAAENWDAPIVVTTNVQFFESLFASRTSRSRKVHRIAKSVIVLDEVQTLPIHVLKPCLAVLKELCQLLGCSVVLCTATQPAFTRRESFSIGFEAEMVRAIVPNPKDLHERMKRVRVATLGEIEVDDLVRSVSPHKQSLCIVNTRRHAAEIYTQLTETADPDSIFHLSTFMCAAHRSQELSKIRDRLKHDEACKVVSTQLIEAGVDVDFPVVYRAMAGLDSIAQAAGRCNREGQLDFGQLFVFDFADRLPGLLGDTAAKAREVIADCDDLLSLDAVDRYFRLHYWQLSANLDEHDVMACFQSPVAEFQFRAAASRFQMIEDNSRAVFIPWNEKAESIERELRAIGTLTRRLRRKASRFLVPIYERAFSSMVGADIDVASVEGLPILINRDLYDSNLGIVLERAGFHDPGSLVI
ncbi:MAG: CRISPR-associated helicase Cas3' [Planctomycetota bacterium]